MQICLSLPYLCYYTQPLSCLWHHQTLFPVVHLSFAGVICIIIIIYLYTQPFFLLWVCALWTKFNNCPTRCDLFSLLHFCRQLYMFRVLTPIIRSSYSCNYSLWHWSRGSTTIGCHCWATNRNKINWIQMHLVGQLLNFIPSQVTKWWHSCLQKIHARVYTRLATVYHCLRIERLLVHYERL